MSPPLVERDSVEAALRAAQQAGAAWAELFAEAKHSTSALLDEGRIEDLSSSHDRGAGVRVTVGETTCYAHSTDMSAAGLADAARIAAAAAKGNGNGAVVQLPAAPAPPSRAAAQVLPGDVAAEAKVALLMEADEVGRSYNSSITQVGAHYGSSRRRILVANTDGTFASDDQVRTVFSVNCVASGDGGLQTGRETVGYTVGYELFDDHAVADIAREAARRAVLKLNARPVPAGTLPVVIAKGGGGVLFHEACGHGLEADLVDKGASVFKGRVGTQVASPGLTLVDDGTMGVEWGAVSIDDEGYPAQRNVLIDNGVLTDYMYDVLRSRAAGRAPSGNGRRQNYKCLPMVRMTNTFVANGDIDPDDIIADTSYGVYVTQLGGGQVDTASGNFLFGMTEAYLIEDGKVTEPLREGNLVGNGPQVLADIDLIGNDFAMGSPGMCGKDGQGVPVGDGQPTLRVPALTVGGTAA